MKYMCILYAHGDLGILLKNAPYPPKTFPTFIAVVFIPPNTQRTAGKCGLTDRGKFLSTLSSDHP
jgi:hypothetical protein